MVFFYSIEMRQGIIPSCEEIDLAYIKKCHPEVAVTVVTESMSISEGVTAL